MEVSEVKQRLLTDFFTYYPMGGALYDKNGALIDINKSLNEKFPFTNEADFLLNNLFRTDLLTDLQKQYLRGGSVVSGSLPVPYSIIPSMNENREIPGYNLLFFVFLGCIHWFNYTNFKANQNFIQYFTASKSLYSMVQRY